MSERTSYTEGTPSWVDLSAEDFEGARKFYAGVFGWEIPPGDENFGGYSNAKVKGKMVAGMSPRMDESQPSTWNVYLAVKSADATAQKIKDNGGQLAFDPMDVGEFGRMAFAIDPQGAMFGIWQANQHLGSELVNEPSAFSWAEVFTNDGKGADEFYAGVFGYGLEAMDAGPDMDYNLLKVGDRIIGGRMVMPEGGQPHWGIYFAVEDTDAAVAKIKELGGTIRTEPMDTPYGRMAEISDPWGAKFSIITLAQEQS